MKDEKFNDYSEFIKKRQFENELDSMFKEGNVSNKEVVLERKTHPKKSIAKVIVEQKETKPVKFPQPTELIWHGKPKTKSELLDIWNGVHKLKNEKIYEAFLDELTTFLGKDLDNEKDKINVKPVEKRQDKERDDIDVQDTKSNYNDGKMGLPPEFVNRLVMYIDTFFPTETKIGNSLSNELRKVIDVGDGKELDKAKKKVRDIIYKEKMKMLDRISKRCTSVLVGPK